MGSECERVGGEDQQEPERKAEQIHRVFGHLRVRDLPEEQLRAAVHQLRERAPAAAVQQQHVQGGGDGVPPGGHSVPARGLH